MIYPKIYDTIYINKRIYSSVKETTLENINQVFKISREPYGSNSAMYNNSEFTVLNKFNIGGDSSFNWGDTSSDSEALSYAILDKVASKEIASQYAKLYTKDVIAKIKKDSWSLNASAVIQWITENTNYSIDESAYIKDGTTVFELTERRQEERRKESRRIKREQDFQEEAQRRLKVYEAKQQDRRKEERRGEQDRRVSAEKDFQEELHKYKKQIMKQNVTIEAYQKQLKKYKLFIESLDIKSMYAKYCDLDNQNS